MLRGEREDASSHMALNRGSETSNEKKRNFEPYIMKEDSEKDYFLLGGGRKRRGKEREEEVQQLNIPQPVVNYEWGRKTMGPLILRARSLSFLLLTRSSFLCQVVTGNSDTNTVKNVL